MSSRRRNNEKVTKRPTPGKEIVVRIKCTGLQSSSASNNNESLTALVTTTRTTPPDRCSPPSALLSAFFPRSRQFVNVRVTFQDQSSSQQHRQPLHRHHAPKKSSRKALPGPAPSPVVKRRDKRVKIVREGESSSAPTTATEGAEAITTNVFSSHDASVASLRMPPSSSLSSTTTTTAAPSSPNMKMKKMRVRIVVGEGSSSTGTGDDSSETRTMNTVPCYVITGLLAMVPYDNDDKKIENRDFVKKNKGDDGSEATDVILKDRNEKGKEEEEELCGGEEMSRKGKGATMVDVKKDDRNDSTTTSITNNNKSIPNDSSVARKKDDTANEFLSSLMPPPPPKTASIVTITSCDTTQNKSKEEQREPPSQDRNSITVLCHPDTAASSSSSSLAREQIKKVSTETFHRQKQRQKSVVKNSSYHPTRKNPTTGSTAVTIAIPTKNYHVYLSHRRKILLGAAAPSSSDSSSSSSLYRHLKKHANDSLPLLLAPVTRSAPYVVSVDRQLPSLTPLSSIDGDAPASSTTSSDGIGGDETLIVLHRFLIAKFYSEVEDAGETSSSLSSPSRDSSPRAALAFFQKAIRDDTLEDYIVCGLYCLMAHLLLQHGKKRCDDNGDDDNGGNGNFLETFSTSVDSAMATLKEGVECHRVNRFWWIWMALARLTERYRYCRSTTVGDDSLESEEIEDASRIIVRGLEIVKRRGGKEKDMEVLECELARLKDEGGGRQVSDGDDAVCDYGNDEIVEGNSISDSSCSIVSDNNPKQTQTKSIQQDQNSKQENQQNDLNRNGASPTVSSIAIEPSHQMTNPTVSMVKNNAKQTSGIDDNNNFLAQQHYACFTIQENDTIEPPDSSLSNNTYEEFSSSSITSDKTPSPLPECMTKPLIIPTLPPMSIHQMQQPPPTSSPENNNNSSSTSQKRICHCKRSKCLKLYCDCFASSLLCTSKCTCTDCHNLSFTSHKRKEAIESLLQRNPTAFSAPKLTKREKRQGLLLMLSSSSSLTKNNATNDSENANESQKMTSTRCYCRKSRCLKKYCDCFYVGVTCTPSQCRCTDCGNYEGSHELMAAIKLQQRQQQHPHRRQRNDNEQREGNADDVNVADKTLVVARPRHEHDDTDKHQSTSWSLPPPMEEWDELDLLHHSHHQGLMPYEDTTRQCWDDAAADVQRDVGCFDTTTTSTRMMQESCGVSGEAYYDYDIDHRPGLLWDALSSSARGCDDDEEEDSVDMVMV